MVVGKTEPLLNPPVEEISTHVTVMVLWEVLPISVLGKMTLYILFFKAIPMYHYQYWYL